MKQNSAQNKGPENNKRPFLLSYGIFSFVVGIFLSTFDIVVHASFLSHYSYKYLALAYLISGLLGTGISYAFSALLPKIPTGKLSYIALGTVFLLSSGYFAMAVFTPEENTALYGMVIFFPVNMLILLSLWRYGRELVFPNHTRILFPIVRITQFLGMAIGGVFFSLLLFVTEFSNLIYIPFFSLLNLFPLLALVNKTSRNSNFIAERRSNYIPVRNKLFLFFSSRITTYLILFTIVSATIGFTIHFAFINVAWTGFFTLVGLSKFYGIFILVAFVFIYGLDRYIIKRILFTYDSPYSIIILPLLILLVLILSILGYFLLGNIQAHEHFNSFFLLLILTKITFISAYFIIQVPSLRALFYSLDIRFRQVVYSKIEGTAIMVGLFIAGLIILVLNILNFYSLTIILFIAIAFSLIWMWLAIKLLQEYRKTQENVLTKMRFQKSGIDRESSFLEQLRNIISSDDELKIIAGLKLAELHQPLEYESELKQLLSHPSRLIRNHVLNCIERGKIDSALPELVKVIESVPEEDNINYERVINTFKYEIDEQISEEQIKHKVYAGSAREREELALIINQSDIAERDGLLTTLSKDYEPAVRHAAVKAMAQRKGERFSYSLLDFLYPGKFEPYALEAIAKSGDKAIDYLERESMVPGIDDLILARIMRLYGRIGSEKSISLLLTKLGGFNDYIKMHSIRTLIEQRFQANQKNKYKIQSLIVNLASEITYNFYVTDILKSKNKFHLLYHAYLDELQLNYKQLFHLLSLIYNPNIISSLQQLFLFGSRAQISHAIELADQYIDSDIKPLIFPILEDISIEDRLKRLEFYFPQAKINPKQILANTLTHDFNKLSLYPRACAMLLIYNLKFKEYESELIFNASHPETLLSETALFVLDNLHKDAHRQITANLKVNKFDELSIKESKEHLLLTKYAELKEMRSIQTLSEFVSLELAKAAKKIFLKENEELSIDNIIDKYSLIAINNDVSSAQGTIKLTSTDKLLPTSYLFDMGFMSLQTSAQTTIWLFESSVVKELIYDNVDLAHSILKGIESLKFFKMMQNERK